MLRALRAIAGGGGEAYPERGGWWRTAPSGSGSRLVVEPKPGSVQGSIEVVTVRSLHARGLLDEIPNPDLSTNYHHGYRITAAGRAILQSSLSPDSLVQVDGNVAVTWGAFCAVNKEGFSDADIALIGSELRALGKSTLGGGAAPTFTIHLLRAGR